MSILLFSLAIATAFTTRDQDQEVCGPNTLRFLGHCFCEPGWIDATYNNMNPNDAIDNETHLHLPQHLERSYDIKSLHIHKRPKCTKPLLQMGDCDCEKNKHDGQKDPYWLHPKGSRCHSLCHMCVLGVITANATQWAQLESEAGI